MRDVVFITLSLSGEPRIAQDPLPLVLLLGTIALVDLIALDLSLDLRRLLVLSNLVLSQWRDGLLLHSNPFLPLWCSTFIRMKIHGVTGRAYEAARGA